VATVTASIPHSELLADAREALDYIADRLPPMGMTSIPEEPTKPAEANALHDAKRRIYRDLSGLEEQLESVSAEAHKRGQDTYEARALLAEGRGAVRRAGFGPPSELAGWAAAVDAMLGDAYPARRPQR